MDAVQDGVNYERACWSELSGGLAATTAYAADFPQLANGGSS